MQEGNRILLIDLETSPIEAFSWGPMWETNLIEITEQSKILSYSAKWLGGEHWTKGWPDYKDYKKGVLNDKEIVKDIWHLLNEAEIVIAQNGKQFDIKVMTTRFLYHGLGPPSPYRVIDPKTEAKRYLRLPSNSLDNICDYFGIGRKMEHEGFGLWRKCMTGDRHAWKRMKAYNRHDVVLMEQVYLLLRPYMKTHPNMAMYQDKTVCPKCSSAKGFKRDGFYTNQTTKYQVWKCKNCGGQARTTLNIREIKPLISI
jgi:RNase P subunit RPR2